MRTSLWIWALQSIRHFSSAKKFTHVWSQSDIIYGTKVEARELVNTTYMDANYERHFTVKRRFRAASDAQVRAARVFDTVAMHMVFVLCHDNFPIASSHTHLTWHHTWPLRPIPILSGQHWSLAWSVCAPAICASWLYTRGLAVCTTCWAYSRACCTSSIPFSTS